MVASSIVSVSFAVNRMHLIKHKTHRRLLRIPCAWRTALRGSGMLLDHVQHEGITCPLQCAESVLTVKSLSFLTSTSVRPSSIALSSA